MKSKKNALLKSTLIATSLAAVLFVISGVVFDISFGGNFQMTDYAFSKMAAGTLAIGLGFGLPTVVYGNDRLSLPVQTLIHMGIGCVVMTAAGFLVGWIPTDKGVLAAVIAIAGEVVTAFVVWLFFYAYQKRVAKEMNKRIAEKNQ